MDELKARLRKATGELEKIREDKAVAYSGTGDGWHDNPYFNRLIQDETAKVTDISNINQLISRARVHVPAKANTDRVAFGSIVHLSKYSKVSGKREEQVWEVTGYGETDTDKQRMAYNAPLMKNVMGLKVEDTCQVDLPAGPVELEVLALFGSWDEVPSELKELRN